MILIRQASQQASPLINIVKQGESPLFAIGDGDAHVYQLGYTPFRDWPKIVAAHTSGGTIILDFSTEAALPVPDTTTNLISALPAGCRLIVLAQNLDYIDAVSAIGDDSFRAVFMHSFLRTLNWWFKTKGLPPERKTFSRDYCCLLNRTRPHRLAIFGWLKARGYLERGNVSFHGAEIFADKTRLAKAIEHAVKVFPSFQAEIEIAAASEMPFINFEKVEGENFISSVDVPAYDAPVSLVAESEMVDMRRYTEKSLKALIAGHRPVVAGNRGVCRQLSDLGFVLPGFAHRHDLEANSEARLRGVLAEFEHYMEMPTAERRDWVEATQAGCRENAETFITKTEAVIRRSFEDLAAALA